eukprot:m.282627 g.282627  ORF g.282627 m.282627 type:complete len:1666 (-) comp17752_c0_seq11:672-5669(-)
MAERQDVSEPRRSSDGAEQPPAPTIDIVTAANGIHPLGSARRASVVFNTNRDMSDAFTASSHSSRNQLVVDAAILRLTSSRSLSSKRDTRKDTWLHRQTLASAVEEVLTHAKDTGGLSHVVDRRCRADFFNHRQSQVRNSGECTAAGLSRREQLRVLWRRAYAYARDKLRFGWCNRRMLMQVVRHDPITVMALHLHPFGWLCVTQEGTVDVMHPVLGTVDGTVHLNSFEPRRSLARTVTLAKFDAIGSMLIVATSDNELQVHSVRFAKTALKFKLESAIRTDAKIRSIAWSRDGDLIAVGTNSASVLVFSVLKDGQLKLTESIYEPHLDDVVSVAVSSRSGMLATGCKDKQVRVFDLTSRQPNHPKKADNENATAQTNMANRLSDADRMTDAPRLIYTETRDRVYALEFEPTNQQVLLVGADDNKVQLVTPRLGVVLFEVDVHADYVRAVAFTPSGKNFISAAKDGQILVCDTSTGQPVFDLRVQDNELVNLLSMATSGHYFVAGSCEKASGGTTRLTMFSVIDYEKVAKDADHGSVRRQVARLKESFVQQMHDKSISCLIIHPVTHWVCCGSADGALRIFDIDEGATLLYQRLDPEQAVVAVRAQPDSDKLLVALEGGSLFLVDVNADTIALFHKFELTQKAHLRGFDYSSTGEHIVAVFSNRDLRILDAREGLELSALQLTAVPTCLASRKCQEDDDQVTEEFAIGTHSGKIVLFDVVTESVVWTSHCHTKEVFDIAFSDDGSLICSGSRDKTAAIVSRSSGHETHKIQHEQRDHVRCVAFSPRGILATGCPAYGTISLHSPTTEYSYSGFNVRRRTVNPRLTCCAWAPASARFEGLLVVGNSTGEMALLDLSLIEQQPTQNEVRSEIQAESRDHKYERVAAMVKRHPYVVNCPGVNGNTPMHLAMQKRRPELLKVLLGAPVPRCWLPLNDFGFDPLSYYENFTCARLLLNHLVRCKQEQRLCPLPITNDRSLRSIIKLARRYPELVASFLQEFGLEASVHHHEEVEAQREPEFLWFKRMKNLELVIVGTQMKQTPPILRILSREPTAVGNATDAEDDQPATLIPAYIGLPEVAGLLRPATYTRPGRTTRNNLLMGMHSTTSSLGKSQSSVNHQAKYSPANVHNSLLHLLLQAGDARLFGNKIMKKMLQFKWQTYARRLFYFELAIFIAYLMIFQTFVILNAELHHDYSDIYNEPVGRACAVLAAIIPVFALRQLARERRQIEIGNYSGPPMLHTLFALVSDGWSCLQTSVALLSLLSCILYFAKEDAVVEVASLTIFLLWLQIFYFLRAFEATGALVRIVFRVLLLSLPFLCLLLVVMIGSGSCYYLLFAKESSPDALPFESDTTFSNVLFNAYTIFVLSEMELVLQEFNVETMHNETFAKLLFVLMSVITTVFMLNLLIGLMSEYMSQVHEREGDAYPFELATIIAELELSMPRRLINEHNFPRWLHMLTPKSEDDRGGPAPSQSSTQNDLRNTIATMMRANERLVEQLSRRTDQALERIEGQMKDLERRVTARSRRPTGNEPASLNNSTHNLSPHRPRRLLAGGRPLSVQDADLFRHTREGTDRLSPTRARSPLLGKPLTRHSSVPVPRVRLSNIDEDLSSNDDAFISQDDGTTEGRPVRRGDSLEDPLVALDEDVEVAIEAVVVRTRGRSNSLTGSSLV